jgi:hypothetical protein
MGTGVDFAAFDTVEHDSQPLGLVKVFVAVVVVKPKPKDQKEPGSQIEEKKNFYFQFNHSEYRGNC